MTTATSETTANPSGTFTVRESLQPVRAFARGTWIKLNPALHHATGGRIAPALTTDGITLSDGGNGPLVVMDVAGRTLSLSWPGTLPVPTMSGASATYAAVLPGVDLVVTVDSQGGFSDTLVVHNASAASNPALAHLAMGIASPDLSLAASAAGDVTAAAAPGTPAVITAQAPMIWDSTPPPAGTPTVTAPDGTVLDSSTGLPAYSSVTAPGAAAHTTTIPVGLSRTAVTLSPPASVLMGSAITYPVYIDPTWHPAGDTASASTQVDSGFPTTSFWDERSDLQSGKCPLDITPPKQSCDGLGVARSFIRMPIPPQLTSASVVHSAYLYMTEDWAPSCTKTSVRLYSVGSISSSTTWNNQPGWSSQYLYQDAAFGYPGCGYHPNDITWDVTSTVANDAGAFTNQTWGLRAASETDEYQWKQFWSGSQDLSLSVTYNDPPNKPTGRASDPGGSCAYTSGTAPVIGNDDVTLYAAASDNDGDNNLTTRFMVLDSHNQTLYDSSQHGTSFTGGDNATAQLVLSRQLFNGSPEATYHWYAITTDDNNLTSPAPADDCYFTFNPAGPGEPQISFPNGNHQTIGGHLKVTFSAASGACPGSGCPVGYSYQIAAGAPVPATPDSNGYWSGSITVPEIGDMYLQVTALSAGGNPGVTATKLITGDLPGSPYADGDFNGDGQPDLLTLGASTTEPSLWLSAGTGPGTLGNPIDIGAAGTGINQGGSDGPGDWAGTQVLHGDFTGHRVQDVMAYYPATGAAMILAGSGDGAPLRPFSGTVSELLPGTLQDPTGGNDYLPQTLVAAGNASESSTGVADLIGIAGSPGSPATYTLDLWTSCNGCGPIGYGASFNVLSALPPAGGTWNNYTLATAQPGGNPNNTVLFALDETNGQLWESANPTGTNNCSTDYTQAGCTVIGTPHSTWTQITTNWSSTPTQLTADINASNQTELWSTSGGTATAYTLSCSPTCSLTQENTDTITPTVHDEWPLADGTGPVATDTINTSNDASLSGGAGWSDNNHDYFGNYISLDGATGYLTPPANTIPSTDTTPKISLWFRTTTADGILVSLDASALSSGNSTTSPFYPVLYVGTDGHLYGEWWDGSALSPAVSAKAVDDGLWHHAILTSYGTSQTLYVDNQQGVSITGNVSLSPQATNLTFGGGYTGYNWPNEPHYHQNGSTGYSDYFSGDIAEVIYSQPNGS